NRCDHRTDPSVRIGKLPGELRRNRLHFFERLVDGDVRPQSGDNIQVMPAAGCGLAWRELHRRPELDGAARLAAERKGCWHHTDDGASASVHRHIGADGRWTPAETPLPQAIADHGDGR